MNRELTKFQERYPIGCAVLYSNYGGRGHGNRAVVLHYLHRTGEPDKVAAIQLQFKGGGMHLVTPNQMKKYYSKIS